MYDLFAIKTCLEDEHGEEQIVGHLSLELSRFTKYLLDRGAIVIAILSTTHYRLICINPRGPLDPMYRESKNDWY